MRVIVDANIIFSGILNSNGKIGDLLINSGRYVNFIAPNFLRTEIAKHHTKLCQLSGLNIDQIRESEFHIYKGITFISEEQIKVSTWHLAEKLVENIDPNDTPYIAFSKHFRCKIWSGDKQLIRGLTRKGFTNFILTDELYAWLQQKKSM